MSLRRDDEGALEAEVTIRMGPIKATFKGRGDILDKVEPVSCRIVGAGSGGLAGFAKGQALVRLSADKRSTILEYEIESAIGGKIAQLGTRLVDATARKFASEFFGNLDHELSRLDEERKSKEQTKC